MTEAEWIEGTSPERMLNYLRHRAGERKLRLFGCACCRRIWHLLTDERGRRAVEVSERFADGRADLDELRDTATAARAALRAAPWDPRERRAALQAATRTALVECAGDALLAAGRSPQERRAQAALLHDLFGNPFHPVRLDPALLAWEDGTVVRLARALYDEGRFADLPVLADALEEAGCTDEQVLSHCRGPGPHVRGCWLVDLLTGRA